MKVKVNVTSESGEFLEQTINLNIILFCVVSSVIILPTIYFSIKERDNYWDIYEARKHDVATHG